MLFKESVLVLVLYTLASVLVLAATAEATLSTVYRRTCPSGACPYPLVPSYPLPLPLPLPLPPLPLPLPPPFSALFLPLLALEFDTLGTADTPKADLAALTLGTTTGVPEATPSADAELEEEALPELGAKPGVSGERCDWKGFATLA